MRELKSMEECVYFTNRNIGKGYIKAWVFREICPKCKKDMMSKPKDSKTGKYKVRADEYICPGCNFKIEKGEYEDTLTINIKYKCSHCSYEGEMQCPFKRRKIQIVDESGKKKTVDGIRFQCEKCKGNIDIVKKMKI